MTEKETLFCKEYIIDFNATDAAKRAGYSENSSRSIGFQNLSKLHIQTEINKQIDARNERVVVKQDRIIYELAKIAFADIKNFINEDGSIDYSRIDDSNSPVVSEFNEIITTVENDKKGYESTKTNRKLKLYDKIKALELLGKHLAMFTDKVDANITGPVVNIDKADFKKFYDQMIKEDDC